MKECDIFRGIEKYSDPSSYIFSGGQDSRNSPTPGFTLYQEGKRTQRRRMQYFGHV